YRGQKRWHTILGLVFGVLACTWAFSGMLSMGVQLPFLSRGNRPATPTPAENRRGRNQQAGIPAALRGGRMRLEAFAAKSPAEALKQLEGSPVKEFEFTLFAGEPVYLATLTRSAKVDRAERPGGSALTRLVPVRGEPITGFGEQRI